MSKTSLKSTRSRASVRSHLRRVKTIKKEEHISSNLKPSNFCCTKDDYDVMTKYNQRNPPIKLSMTEISHAAHGCPALKVRIDSIRARVVSTKRRISKTKTGTIPNLAAGSSSVSLNGQLLWYHEDEVAIAKNTILDEKLRAFIETGNKNAILGEKKVKALLQRIQNLGAPRWYQDLSTPQMQSVMALEEIMITDYEERITNRTQEALSTIGITSTFVEIPPSAIRRLQSRTKLDPIDFLREIYKIVTGNYFEEEHYTEKEYDCNERIILSAIAFLALPETVIQLNKRLPPVQMPRIPPKPQPPIVPFRQRCISPYNEELFMRPNWKAYRNKLNRWRERCKLIPIPRIIMPPPRTDYSARRETALMAEEGYKFRENPLHESTFKVDHKHQETILAESEQQHQNSLSTPLKTETKSVDETLTSDENLDITVKDKFDFAISGLGGKPGPVEYTISGTLNTPEQKTRSWLGEKDTHYVVSGVFENADPPEFPVSFVMNGISNVTPTNSDEKFFTELRLGNGPKKIYPSGRQNLSRNWQEWLQNADEEFLKIEKEASKLIKSVEATMRLVIPEPTCDSCCSCRQTRKSNIKWHNTKTPYMVIDSIAEDNNEKKYIVGSMAMHSPAPSPRVSEINLLEVIASRDNMNKQLIINGITNENGETTFYISGVMQDIEHIPHHTITKTSAPKPLRNVPPCSCTIHQILNDDITSTKSTDDIPWTKNDGLCFGKKYRPQEAPAYSCKESPKDRCCRMNPFNKAVKQSKRKHENLAEKDDQRKKKMYSLPAFQACGDEDGMAVCGGAWGAVNIPDPEELAAREEEAKQILRAPPCGEKPGRTVCGGPWGTIVPSPKRVRDEDEDEEEEEEEDEEAADKKKKALQEISVKKDDGKKKNVNRDKFCEMNLGLPKDLMSVTDKKESDKKKNAMACQADNKWNLLRTAPTVEPTCDEYEKTLKLTPANPLIVPTTYKRKERKENGEMFESKQNDLDTRNSGKNKFKHRNHKDKRMESKIHDFKHMDKLYRRKSSRFPKRKESIKLNHTNNINVGQIRQAKNLGNNSMNESYRKSHQETSVKFNTNFKITFNAKTTKNERWTAGPKKSVTYPNDTKWRVVKNKLLGNKTLQNKLLNTSRKGSIDKLEKIKEIKEESKKILQSLDKFNIQPAIIPEASKMCTRPSDSDDKCSQSLHTDIRSLNDNEINDNQLIKEGPFGWKTKSEQELPAEKTLVYLAEPSYPIQTIPVRPGGKPCHCRENRRKKKLLLYNIGGLINQGTNKKKQQTTQLIEGVTYVTPPPSPKISDEYVPEYELYKSPYEMCAREQINETFKYIEQFSGPKSLLPKKSKNVQSCSCGNGNTANIKQDSTTEEALPINQSVKTDDTKEKELKESEKSNEWSNTLKDEGLIDYFTRHRDKVPCWLKCGKFSKNPCATPRKLQVMKPVCECKYERKVLRKEEEKKQRTERQKRLKTYKKQPFTHVVETSRPMAVDTKLMISDVKRIPKEDEYGDEVKYCITGVAENYSMGPVRYVVSGVTMHTPVVTPEPSKEEIPCICAHRHWSPMNIAPGPLPTNRTIKTKKQETKPIINNNDLEHRAYSTANKTYENSVSHNYFEKTQTCYGNRSDVTGQLASANLSPKLLKKNEDKGYLTSTINDTRYKSEINGGDTHMANKDFHTWNRTVDKTFDETLLSLSEDYLDTTNVNKSKDDTKSPETLDKSVNQKKSNKSGNNNTIHKENDLMKIMHEELKKMADEGFPLAKLPASHLMPQLQFFIMYRKGVAYSEYDKKLIMDSTIKSWNTMSITRDQKLTKPTLNIPNKKLKKLTFDNAIQMKKKIAQVKTLWLSDLRKLRVMHARLLWSSMEFGRFPNMSFKQAYFTYLPAKEADGHVFRPWKKTEILHQL